MNFCFEVEHRSTNFVPIYSFTKALLVTLSPPLTLFLWAVKWGTYKCGNDVVVAEAQYASTPSQSHSQWATTQWTAT